MSNFINLRHFPFYVHLGNWQMHCSTMSTCVVISSLSPSLLLSILYTISHNQSWGIKQMCLFKAVFLTWVWDFSTEKLLLNKVCCSDVNRCYMVTDIKLFPNFFGGVKLAISYIKLRSRKLSFHIFSYFWTYLKNKCYLLGKNTFGMFPERERKQKSISVGKKWKQTDELFYSHSPPYPLFLPSSLSFSLSLCDRHQRCLPVLASIL